MLSQVFQKLMEGYTGYVMPNIRKMEVIKSKHKIKPLNSTGHSPLIKCIQSCKDQKLVEHYLIPADAQISLSFQYMTP